MKGPIKRGIVIRNEHSSKHYNTEFLHNLYAAEGKGVFDVRTITLGHIQQGGAPSPFDRSYGTKCGHVAATKIIEILEKPDKPEGKAYLVGMNRRHVSYFTPYFDIYLFLDGLHGTFRFEINFRLSKTVR